MASYSGAADNDVVDGDEDQFDRVANEAHDRKSDSTRHGDLLELLCIGLGASLDEAARVVCKLLGALNHIADWIALVGEEGHGLENACHGNGCLCACRQKRKVQKITEA